MTIFSVSRTVPVWATTDVVAPQVDQHQVFGKLLGIAEQVLFQRQISFFVGAAWTGAGDGADRDQTFLDAHQHFRRRPHHVEVAEVEEACRASG